MGLAKTYQKELKSQLNFHAAWYPVANTFRVGTYGLVEGGVLRELGHVTDDFGVDIGKLQRSPVTGPSAFESRGVVTIRAVAGAKVEAFPPVGDLDGQLTFSFKNSDSVVFKAPDLELESLPSVNLVAHALGQLLGWDSRFRVVSGVYRAQSPVVLLAADAGTTITFDAKVSALKLIEGGSGDVSFTASASSERGFRTVGKPGVVGLQLFKLGWFSRPKLLGPKDPVPVEDGLGWSELPDDV